MSESKPSAWSLVRATHAAGQGIDTRVHYRLPSFGKMLCGVRPPGFFFFTDNPPSVNCPECRRALPKGEP